MTSEHPKELLRLSTMEKLLEEWDPTDGLSMARKKSIQYDLREARMAAEARSGKAADEMRVKAGKIAELAERKIWEATPR